jgi:hypothetical protein
MLRVAREVPSLTTRRKAAQLEGSSDTEEEEEDIDIFAQRQARRAQRITMESDGPSEPNSEETHTPENQDTEAIAVLQELGDDSDFYESQHEDEDELANDEELPRPSKRRRTNDVHDVDENSLNEPKFRPTSGQQTHGRGAMTHGGATTGGGGHGASTRGGSQAGTTTRGGTETRGSRGAKTRGQTRGGGRGAPATRTGDGGRGAARGATETRGGRGASIRGAREGGGATPTRGGAANSRGRSGAKRVKG